MKEQYWEAGDLPELDFLRDLISENVVAALQQMLDEGDIWFNVTKDGNLSITFHSFDMPEKEGEPSDIWHKEFTLLDRAIEWAGDYDIENISDAQKKDLEARADAFDRMAAEFRKAAGLPSNVEFRPTHAASSREVAPGTQG